MFGRSDFRDRTERTSSSYPQGTTLETDLDPMTMSLPDFGDIELPTTNTRLRRQNSTRGGDGVFYGPKTEHQSPPKTDPGVTYRDPTGGGE